MKSTLRRCRMRFLATQAAAPTPIAPITKPRRKWPRRAVLLLAGSMGLYVVVQQRDAREWQHWVARKSLLWRSAWMLATTFAAHTDMRSDWKARHADAAVLADALREQRRMQWWEAIARVRDQQAQAAEMRVRQGTWEDTLIALLLGLVPHEQGDEGGDDVDRAAAISADSELIGLLVDHGAIEILLQYLAFEKPCDGELLRQIARCLVMLLSATKDGVEVDGIDPNEEQERVDAPRNCIALGDLSRALQHLINQRTLSDADLTELGSILVGSNAGMEDVQCCRRWQGFHAPPADDLGLESIVDGLLQLLRVDMPPTIQEFGLSALATLVRTATEADNAVNTHAFDQLFSPLFARLLKSLPRSNSRLQSQAAALIAGIIDLAQQWPRPIPSEAFETWLELLRAWAESSRPVAEQLAAAAAMHSLSKHPRTRQPLLESADTLESVFELARRVHDDNIKSLLALPARKRQYSPAAVLLKNPRERVQMQQHLSSVFRHICTSFRRGEMAMTESVAAAPVFMQSKHSLPMSSMFRSFQDVTDLPILGADEYDTSTEFGWIDILTRWTSSADQRVRENAITILLHLLDDATETASPEAIQQQQHMLQAWLMSMLQHVQHVSEGGAILAIKQVEHVAKISEQVTPGNEKVRFNAAVVDAATAAIAVLAENHLAELLQQGVVPLMALLAAKCTTNLDPTMEMQAARVMANLVAACCTARAAQMEAYDRVLNEQGAEWQQQAELPSTELDDVERMLSKTACGRTFLNKLQAWPQSEDPMQRSEFYRVLANLAAYRDLLKRGRLRLPVYAEGVYPIVPRAMAIQAEADDTSNDVSSDMDPNANADVDIVFVHGLRGHPFQTWRTDMGDSEDSDEEIWPDILLYQDLMKAGVRPRLITLGYDAGMVTWSSPWPSLTLEERAKLMLRALYDANIGRKQHSMERATPVIFVTHSMGGLLVKKMLLQAQADDQQQAEHPAAAGEHNHSTLANATQAVVFIAVPHFGSDLAFGMHSNALRALLSAHPSIGDLCASHDRRLEALNDGFAQLNIPCTSLGEQLPTRLGYGFTAMVVKPESANPGFGEFHILHGLDHMTICKAKTRAAPCYQQVLYALLRWTKGSDIAFQPTITVTESAETKF